MNRRLLITRAVLAASITLLAACSDSTSGGSETTEPPAAGPVAATVPATDAVTTTIAATTTSVAASSTTVAEQPALVLRDTGIGEFSLGDEAEPVVDGISAELGAPTRDETADYPVADGLGEYTTADGSTGFVAPTGRSVCWSINLCVEFGGASPASLSFTGWTYTNDPTAALSSTSGGTIGSRWSDLTAMEVDAGGCYSSGSGTIDGIRLALESTGEPFSSFDDAGNYVANVPATGDVTITSMETGKSPVFLYGDC